MNPVGPKVAPQLHIQRSGRSETCLAFGERHREKRGDTIVQGRNMAVCQPELSRADGRYRTIADDEHWAATMWLRHRHEENLTEAGRA
jgi:hypothetical protein